ncbi:hypothetical protein B0A48_00055 [Cryoendolithus antarcticus]|uniref:GDP/GTP exchange factor Sec2 N-terminal domain-containing protein n=1 Tax=Cryoendolithus antarcticus TaxID=1507870 RepID=A0A1V8TTL2_9PEZI|nr:hypothetical protein B0A48_00055 [Cryoendolithus antarcticus]
MATNPYPSSPPKPHPQHQPHDSGLSLTASTVLSPEAQKRISDLEAELSLLTDKVASASQRFADYENEIRVLNAQVRQEKRRNASLDCTVSGGEGGGEAGRVVGVAERAVNGSAAQKPGISRFGSFMHARKAIGGLGATPETEVANPLASAGAAARERELEAQLSQERDLRLAAEAKMGDTAGEVEELTASLFGQANEMVATERKEHARLKERIQVLERRDAKFGTRVQALEERDRERQRRLENLERAVGRAERVRGVLGGGAGEKG